jgi:hypothetical protein
MTYKMTHKNLNKFNFTVIAGDVTGSDYEIL